jgi:hypothetical protein
MLSRHSAHTFRGDTCDDGTCPRCSILVEDITGLREQIRRACPRCIALQQDKATLQTSLDDAELQVRDLETALTLERTGRQQLATALENSVMG